MNFKPLINTLLQMKIRIPERFRPFFMALGVAIGVLIGAISQSAISPSLLSDNWQSPYPEVYDFTLKMSNIFFFGGLLVLFLISMFVEFSKDADSGDKHKQLESSVTKLGKLITQLGFVPPPGFIGALKDYSQKYFSYDRSERTYFNETALQYRQRTEESLQQRLVQIALLTRTFFSEMEKARIGVNVMRYVEVEDNQEIVKSLESFFLFKGPLESLEKSHGVLYLDTALAIVNERPSKRQSQTQSVLDKSLKGLCFPIHQRLELSESEYLALHVPGAPEAFLRDSAVFYENGKRFVEAAKEKSLTNPVVQKIESYFNKHQNQIQSVISIPFKFLEIVESKERVTHRYVLNIHTDKVVDSSEPQLVLFESTLSPFLSSLAEKISNLDDTCAILETLSLEDTR